MTTEPNTAKTLLEFATSDRRTMDWVAAQAVWPEVVQGYHDGVRATTIRAWLIREKGFTDKQLPSGDSFARFLRNNHPKDDE